MGVLTDLIVASRADAADILAARGGHAERWRTLPGKGVDPIKLATLNAILHGGDPDDVAVADGFMADTVVEPSSADGRMVLLVPRELVVAASPLDEDALEAAAERWAATEECEADGWIYGDAEEYLQGFAKLAGVALAEGSDVLLWVCV